MASIRGREPVASVRGRDSTASVCGRDSMTSVCGRDSMASRRRRAHFRFGDKGFLGCAALADQGLFLD